MIDKEEIITILTGVGLWFDAHDYHSEANDIHEVIELIKEQPKIIRCEDCWWYDEEISFCDNCHLPRERTFFCADGKHK